MNQFATIYTAGAPDADQNLNGSFDAPRLANSSGRLNGNSTVLGSSQQSQFVPLYSYGGGNISLKSGANIERLQPDPDSPGRFVADSSRQLPVNWLSRRSEIAPEGTWNLINNLRGDAEALSTTWWVNFPSFFQGIGTLGGGNITMLAGGNVSNVDASLPTQGRMTGRDGAMRLTPSESSLIETGGGDLLLRAGENLDAGVYYTERGTV